MPPTALSLFFTAASPVLQAGLLAASGAALAWHGTLDDAGTRVVARMSFYLFTPALTFSTLASSVTLDSIVHGMWPLLANITFSSFFGLAVGQLVSRALGTPRNFRQIAVVAIAFGNVGNLPLVFGSALCADKGAIFYQALGERCNTKGVAYIAFDICVATLFQFTLALYMLKPPPPGENGEVVDGGGSQLRKNHTVSDLLRSAGDSPQTAVQIEMTAVDAGEQGRLLQQAGFREEREQEEGQRPSVWGWLKAVDWKSALPAPTQAAFGGVVVGCTPPLRRLLFGASPPLRPLAQALELLGAGLIPAAIPLLGAVLYKGPGRSQLPRRVVWGVVVTRLVLQPAVLTMLVVAALHLGLFSAPDPLFLVVLMMSNATPTAINMQTLTVLYNFGAEEMSQLLFLQYLLSLVTLPAFMWVFLRVINAYFFAA